MLKDHNYTPANSSTISVKNFQSTSNFLVLSEDKKWNNLEARILFMPYLHQDV